MQNIDPLYFATPLAVISLMAGLLAYWHGRRRLATGVLLYSLIAYAGAIALKYAVQIPTYSAFESVTGGSKLALGVYFGAQTALFEVGLAYVVARLALSRSKLQPEDAEGYGLGLAFWENGVLLAVPLLIDYVVYYAILAAPNSSTAQVLYTTLYQSSPVLFYPPASAIPLIGYAVLERISSIIAHFSWGLLTLTAAARGRWALFFVALPFGFTIDFLVPFAGVLGLGVFELAIFLVSLLALASALALTRRSRLAEAGVAPIEGSPSNT